MVEKGRQATVNKSAIESVRSQITNETAMKENAYSRKGGEHGDYGEKGFIS